MLGIDTGGTYTDAVLLSSDEVIASAKSLTTHADLALGVGRAIDAVMADASVKPADVELVSLSTTLATNALVEGRGGRVALIAMTLDPEGCRLAGLDAALGGDPVVHLNGGHSSSGDALGVPDLADLDRQLGNIGAVEGSVVEGSVVEGYAVEGSVVEGYAVAAQFSVRHPEHELMVRDHLLATTGRPVTCSHELSSALGGPARAVTCVLNARLIGVIDRLLTATEAHLSTLGVTAPLMVVRGDGSLMSVDVARQRPVETILSGPAASVIGALHLTRRAHDAIVSDIGGTTTDIAVVTNGSPVLSDAAVVGGHRTMVHAVQVHTVGLGGDSEVVVDPVIGRTQLVLGPRRVIPISMLAAEHRDAVHAGLAADERADPTPRTAGRFVVVSDPNAAESLATSAERDLIEQIGSGPVAWRSVAGDRRRELAVERLVRRGVLGVAGVTPTDAAHVLGLSSAFDSDAARRSLELMAAQRDRFGARIDNTGMALAERIVMAVHEMTASTVLGVALAADGLPAAAANSPLAKASRAASGRVVRSRISIEVPIIGLGASASTYYPAVGTLLGAQIECPPFAEVANAVGAVVSPVRVEVVVSIDEPSPDQFRISGAGQPVVASSLDAAYVEADALARSVSIASAIERGAVDPTVTVERLDNIVDLDGTAYFVSSTLTATAVGRARTT